VLCDTRQCYLSRFKRPCGSPLNKIYAPTLSFVSPLPSYKLLIVFSVFAPAPQMLLSISPIRSIIFSRFLQDQTLDEDQIRKISKKNKGELVCGG